MLMTMNLGVALRQLGAVNWGTRTSGVDGAPLCPGIVDGGSSGARCRLMRLCRQIC